MAISSIPRFLSFAIRLNNPPFSLITRINFSTAEEFCTHLLNYPQHPEKTLVKITSQLDVQCVGEVLHRFSSNQPQLGLRFFIWAGLQPKYRHTQYMYSSACKLLQIRRNPGRIREILERYLVEGCQTNAKLFKVVLNLCREARIADEGLWVLRKMGDFDCRPDSTMYNVVIGLFCDKGDLDMAMGLMREMESCNLCPDMITYMSMLKGFSYAGRLEDACQLFMTMKVHGCVPNLVTYSALLDGLCRVGSFERALELLAEMEKEGGECTPNVITYTSVIQSLCENGKSMQALPILERMESFKCHPNRITMSVLIQGLCGEGYIDKAFKLVSNVVVGSHVPRGECYSSLVISLLRIKRFEEADKLFMWMLGSDMRPDGLACSVLMKDLCFKGRFVDAFSLYEDIEKKGFVLTIDSDIYSALLLGLCEKNREVEVAKLANFMVEKGIKINASYIDDIHKHLKGSIRMESLAELSENRK
ncbi:pentatricopeptide repeat-containing protein At5g47360 [Spinacia oleracea]|uniref:Pentatricopeptide repeat-containing protein At5g47360 n=1 Tax=Spinacia oleracea TaxID=3562 RepID=A0A9R0IGN8_SPIOL|nr:pentatricopeptide repeat-containing protein At5g47360-like [Spinacia oleracea]XP_021848819.1 pentatricopeptide repeat-containing protein At5g47360-like [Spinacia oleracea]XP_021848827.1 pentatricopeptide repeat-containing protein At5g47360-like [Spinacia oleracea]XP_021848830.1 pentatricopeptide repeat-containing protein At5g47360-like [Spinacia oleracea]XP_021848836.1 pentatricopeptide repeat-containing protein At5g47360-like [Spinacia oleracea]XP_021848840.1 pentatricopeptide repeat-conta